MHYRLGIDAGGTFTDFVAVDEVGQMWIAKTPSTPDRPSAAIRAGIEQLAGMMGTSLSDLLTHSQVICHHGSTVALNALIQHKGAKVGLLTTDGFRDTLEMRLGHREEEHLYDYAYPPPSILVPRYLRLPVRERIDRFGQVVTPLHEEDVARAAEVFRHEGVEAVAVCFLWSFLNPAHERRAGEILRAGRPEAYISLSVDVLPQIRDYERTSTTALNAYLGPIVGRYINDIEALFQELGYAGQVRYVQSNGGVASGELVTHKPVTALNSGPASGPIAGLFFGQMQDWDNIITIDMGGTSFDICLVEAGQPNMVKNVDVHRYRVGVPMIDIHTLGAGGGSIAWIDPGGILRVGPQSAEAVPGPACYMRGGMQPTVTDADVVLGYLNPDYLLGGQMQIAQRAAEQVIAERIAGPLSLSVTQAALGIFQVVNHNMIEGIRAVSIERGYDPRDFVLVAAGGGGAAHVGRIAQELEIPRVLVPKVASVLCAFGQLVADVRHDHVRTSIASWREVQINQLHKLLEEMERDGRRGLMQEGVQEEDIYYTRTVDLRYVGQVHEVTVELPWERAGGQSDLVDIEELLHRKHEALYTYSERDSVIELVNLGITAWGRAPQVELAVGAPAGADASRAKRTEREVYFAEYGKAVSVDVYDGEKIAADNLIEGPAVVEEVTTTIVVFPGWQLAYDGRGFYVMSLAG